VNISGFKGTGAGGVPPTGNEGYAGMKFGSGVANCNTHDNILTGNQYGILLQDPENTTTPGNNTFTNNTATSNCVSGIEMQHSYGNTFTNNTANSNTSYGFRLDGVSHNTFTGNTANSNTKCGFSLVKGSSTGGCLYNTFTSNTANLNTEYGFREDYGDHNTLTGNTFNLNVIAGLRLKETITNLTVNNNNITNSPTGIDITYSTVQPDVTTWTVTNNNLSGNTSYGISNGGTGTLDAENNWWGDVLGPGNETGSSGDKVVGNVDYTPWLKMQQPQITAVDPSSVDPNPIFLTLKLTGSGFRSGATVWLQREGGAPIPAAWANVVSATEVQATYWGLLGYESDKYDVVLKDPDGLEARLYDGFEIKTLPPAPPCGTGGGTAAVMLGFAIGLLYLAESGRLRKSLRRKAK